MTRSLLNSPVPLAAALVLAATALVACSKSGDAPVMPSGAPASVPTPVAGVYEVRYYVLDSSCPYCRDLKAVIGGPDAASPTPTAAPAAGSAAAPIDVPLAKVYDGRVRFTFRPGFDEHNNPNPEMEPFGFGGSAHGFAGFGPDGKLAFTSPGHHQSRAELVEMIDKMLR